MPDFSAFQMFGKKMFLRRFVKKPLQKFRIHFNLIKTTLSLREYFALCEPVQQLRDYGRAHASWWRSCGFESHQSLAIFFSLVLKNHKSGSLKRCSLWCEKLWKGILRGGLVLLLVIAASVKLLYNCNFKGRRLSTCHGLPCQVIYYRWL